MTANMVTRFEIGAEIKESQPIISECKIVFSNGGSTYVTLNVFEINALIKVIAKEKITFSGTPEDTPKSYEEKCKTYQQINGRSLPCSNGNTLLSNLFKSKGTFNYCTIQ